MEMDRIRYFLAPCKEQSFTRATKRSAVSQPSLSEAIRKLEEAIRAIRLMAVLIIFSLAIGPTNIVSPAEARWKANYADAPHREWFAQQHDRAGWSCCDHGDAHAVYDAYVKNGNWYVPIDGIHHKIEPKQLLDGSNPTGHAVVWYAGSGKNITIFCFAPGTMF